MRETLKYVVLWVVVLFVLSISGNMLAKDEMTSNIENTSTADEMASSSSEESIIFAQHGCYEACDRWFEACVANCRANKDRDWSYCLSECKNGLFECRRNCEGRDSGGLEWW